MAGLRSVTNSNGVVTFFVRFAPNGGDMRLYELPQLPDLDGVGGIVDNIAAGGPATVSFDGRAGQTYLIRCAQFGNTTEEAYQPDNNTFVSTASFQSKVDCWEPHAASVWRSSQQSGGRRSFTVRVAPPLKRTCTVMPLSRSNFAARRSSKTPSATRPIPDTIREPGSH